MVIIFSDYNFYKDTWHGKLNEEQYLRFVNKANSLIIWVIQNKAVPATMEEKAANAECEIVDMLFSNKDRDYNVKSENIDGYSVTYNEESTRITGNSVRICSFWLSYPNNLVYQGREQCV